MLREIVPHGFETLKKQLNHQTEKSFCRATILVAWVE